jgi:hypothetical protein
MQSTFTFRTKIQCVDYKISEIPRSHGDGGVRYAILGCDFVWTCVLYQRFGGSYRLLPQGCHTFLRNIGNHLQDHTVS